MKRFWLFLMPVLTNLSTDMARAVDAPVPTSASPTANAVEAEAAQTSRVLVAGAAESSPDGKILMRLHLMPGQSYAAKLEMNVTEKVQATKTVEFKTHTQITYRLRVLDQEKENESRLCLTFSSLLIEATGPDGYRSVVDTLHPSRSTVQEPMSSYALPLGLVEKSVMGQDLIVHLSPTAEVIRIDGLDKLAARIATPIEGAERKANVARTIKRFLGYSGFQDMKGNLRRSRMLLPASFLARGDTWKTSSEIGVDGDSTLKYGLIHVFRVDAREGGIMTVGVKSNLKPGVPKVEDYGHKYWYNGSGVLHIDEKTGWTLSGHLSTKSKSVFSQMLDDHTYVGSTQYLEFEQTYTCTPLVTSQPNKGTQPGKAPQ